MRPSPPDMAGGMAAALGKCYDAVAKDEDYRPRSFIAALREFQRAVPTN